MFTKPYPNCFRLIPEDKWQALVGSAESLELFYDTLIEKTAELQLEEYLGELGLTLEQIQNLERIQKRVCKIILGKNFCKL